MNSSAKIPVIGHRQSLKFLVRGRNLIYSLKHWRRAASAQSVSMSRPEGTRIINKALATSYLVILVIGMACFPVSALAQDLGTQPQFNTAVQGQSAGTVEGTFLNIVNVIGNYFCPVGAVLSAVHGIIQYRSNRPWVASAVGAVALLSVSGIDRYAEYLVQNGSAMR